ncbi:MAG: hypothetical protein RL603_1496, partial [Pseudomonadota bacterium]
MVHRPPGSGAQKKNAAQLRGVFFRRSETDDYLEIERL